MAKTLETERKVAMFGCSLFRLLKAGDLQAGDLIDVVGGTLQLIVDPFQKVPGGNVVTAITNPGSQESPMQVVEYHLETGGVTGRSCVPGSAEDKHYSQLYWGALS